MTDKEKLDAITEEIHRLVNVRGYDRRMANDLFTFIDSLPNEPVSEGLEQAIDTYLATYFGGEKEKQEWPFLKKMAIHFAEWQKQQMMAKAVDGVVHRFDGCGVASVHYNDPNGVPMAYFISSEELSAGDKVKIITIKED